MRERQFNIIVGAPGHGKSTTAAKLFEAGKDANGIIYKMFLNIDDKAFKKYRHVPFDKYTGGKVKISDMDVKYKDFLKGVLRSFRNGHVMIDDAGNYERDIISDELNKLVSMRRHMGVDVTMIYHGLSFLPIQQFPFINHIILFHTTDNFSYKAGKLPDIKKLEKAKERIAAQVARGNKYYYEVIKLS